MFEKCNILFATRTSVDYQSYILVEKLFISCFKCRYLTNKPIFYRMRPIHAIYTIFQTVTCLAEECLLWNHQNRHVSEFTVTYVFRVKFVVWLTRCVFCFAAQAERQAVNTTIQGSAADIAKAAMLRVSSTVRRRKLQAQLVINLHDELIYEVSFSLVNFLELLYI